MGVFHYWILQNCPAGSQKQCSSSFVITLRNRNRLDYSGLLLDADI